MKLLPILLCCNVCFGLSVSFKNTNDCDLQAVLTDSTGWQLVDEAVPVDKTVVLEVDTSKYPGPYQLEWKLLAEEQNKELICDGNRKLDFLEDGSNFESHSVRW